MIGFIQVHRAGYVAALGQLASIYACPRIWSEIVSTETHHLRERGCVGGNTELRPLLMELPFYQDNLETVGQPKQLKFIHKEIFSKDGLGYTSPLFF